MTSRVPRARRSYYEVRGTLSCLKIYIKNIGLRESIDAAVWGVALRLSAVYSPPESDPNHHEPEQRQWDTSAKVEIPHGVDVHERLCHSLLYDIIIYPRYYLNIN